MDGLGENIPVVRFLHGRVDISGAVEALIRDLHGFSGNLIPVLLGWSFLLIFTGQIDLEIVRAVKKYVVFFNKKAQKGQEIFSVNMGKTKVRDSSEQEGEHKNVGRFLVLRRKTGLGYDGGLIGAAALANSAILEYNSQ